MTTAAGVVVCGAALESSGGAGGAGLTGVEVTGAADVGLGVVGTMVGDDVA